MNESNTRIYYTSDYAMFHFLKGNRDLNEPKINKIVKSVTAGLNFFKYCPIMVNENYFIIDGQHRFYASKKLKLPIYYVIVPNFSLRQIAEINNNQSKWKVRDFMNCYIDADINRDHYKLLEKLQSETHINVSTMISLLMYGKVAQGGQTDAFRDGNFIVKFHNETVNLIEKARQFEVFSAKWQERAFLQAIEKLLDSDKYNHDALLKKLQKHELTIEKRSTCKEYLQHLEELFNHRNSIRQILY